MENKSYSTRGGLITVLSAIVIVPLIVYLLTQQLGWGDDALLYLAPGLFFSLMALGMNGSSSTLQTIFFWVLGIGLTALPYFILGSFLGFIYGKSNYKKITLIIMIILILFAIFVIAYINRSPGSRYNSKQLQPNTSTQVEIYEK